MEDIQKRNKRNNTWTKANSKKVTFTFMYKSDSDILEFLENADNKAGLVKQAIREYIANHKEEGSQLLTKIQ